MKKLLLVLLVVTIIVLPCGCTKSAQSDTENEKKVSLTIVGPWPEYDALDPVVASFNKKYPNCNINYEYVQDFYVNVPKRLATNKKDKIDLIVTDNIQTGSDMLPYTLELSSLGKKLDISDTFDGLLQNFKLQTTNKEDKNKFYAVPFGAEVRGMYVNVTLLDSLGIDVPTNRTELLEACAKLKKAGYIPIQGNPSYFGNQFLYPYVCNLIANSDNYDKTYKMIDKHEDGVAEFFREPMNFLYDLVSKGYYNYKYVETELNSFTDVSNEGYSRDFLNIVSNSKGEFEKKDDLGQVAFMPSIRSISSVIDKTKDDYHSKINYKFILSPVGDNGGYAYLSPTKGIAINKAGDNIDWSLKFINYLFEKDNIVSFCNDCGIVPNTKNALQIVKEEFNVPKQNICQLGQVTFSYEFYSVIIDTIIEISKSNNPKYMSTDSSGKSVMYPFSYYMNNLKDHFSAIK